ncbi:MAG: FAD-binding oxidoreductase [Ectothiorhodospiraceae bacterium]|nr:FAD-binding oxidoreductase [Ectothiorhodospiraceae bacterium]
MRDRYDVVIVGGGLSGSSTAYFLGANPDFRGRVLVVERDPTYANAPSAKATGGIRQQFSTPENIRIGLFGAHFAKNVDEYLAVDGESTGVVFREQGYLLLATSAALPILQANHRTQLAEGADIVFLRPAEIAERFPWVRTDGLEGGFFGQRNEGWVDPYAFLQAFRRKARALGADYVEDRAVDVVTAGGRVTAVRLERGGLVECGAMLDAAGASGGRAVGRMLGVDLPVESRLRTTFVWECREDVSRGPLTVLPSGVAWRPEGRTCIGNLSPPPERDPERFDHEIDHDEFERDIWPLLAEWIPPFEALKVTGAWCCHYDFNTLDENAILGLLPGYDNAYVALGFSGHGMQQSPAVGRALSELIVHGEYRSLDLGRFGYARVATGEGIHESNCW